MISIKEMVSWKIIKQRRVLKPAIFWRDNFPFNAVTGWNRDNTRPGYDPARNVTTSI